MAQQTVKQRAKYRFRPIVLLPMFGFIAALIFFCIFLGICISMSGQGISDLSFLTTFDNLTDLSFLALAGLIMFGFVFSLIFHADSAQLPLTLLSSSGFAIYLLLKFVGGFVSGNTSAVIFFLLAFVASGFLVFSIVKKALDGDADAIYHVAFAATLLLTVFGESSIWNFFQAYGQIGNMVFWGAIFANLILLYFCIAFTVISLNSDYDPNPIILDEFGNPVSRSSSNDPIKEKTGGDKKATFQEEAAVDEKAAKDSQKDD